jgi:D-alanine transaminase
MQRGAEWLELQAGVPELKQWEHLVSRLLEREALREGLLYAQVTGGAAPRLHVPPTPPTPNFFAYARAYRFPRAADVHQGFRAVTAPDQRWARCDLKTTMLLPAVVAKRDAARRGASEVLFVGEGELLREGASSNVVIVEGGSLVTPPQTQHLLPGITRPLIGQIAAEAQLVLREEPIPVERMLRAAEVFIVSTAALLMPVVEVDDQPIGDGKPGPIAADLAARLRARWELP